MLDVPEAISTRGLSRQSLDRSPTIERRWVPTLELVALCCCWSLTYLPLVQQEIWIALFIRTGILTALQVGHVAAAEQACIALGTIGTALVQKRLDLRRAIVLGAAGLGLANLLAISHVIEVFVIARMLSGLALGVVTVCMIQRASLRADAHKTFAIVSAAAVVSISLYQFIAPMVLARFGPAGLFSLPMIEAMIVIALVLIGIPRGSAAAIADEPSHFTLRLAPILGCVAMLSVAAGVMAYMSFIYVVGSTLGFSIAQLSKPVAVGSALAVLGPLFARWLGDRVGARMPIVIALCVVLIVIQIQPRSHLLWMFAVGTGLISSCLMFYMPYALDIIRRTDKSNWWVSTSYAFVLTGNAIGPALAGWAYQHFSVLVLAVLASAMIGIGAGLFWLVGTVARIELVQQYSTGGNAFKETRQ